MLGRRRRARHRAAPRKRAAARAYRHRVERDCGADRSAPRAARRDSRASSTSARRTSQTVVEVGLELAGQPPLGAGRARTVPTDAVLAFAVPRPHRHLGRAARGARAPAHAAIRPITFDHALADGRDDVVLVHLNHRLVQMCLRLLRAEVWAPTTASGCTGSRRASSETPTRHAAVIAHRPPRRHSAATPTASTRRSSRAGGHDHRGAASRRLNVGQIDSKHSTPHAPGSRPTILGELADALAEDRDAGAHALEARSRRPDRDPRTRSAHRATEEIADVAASSTNSASHRAELATELEPDAAAAARPTRSENSCARDIESLSKPLAAIPEEIERETQADSSPLRGADARCSRSPSMFLVPEHRSAADERDGESQPHRSGSRWSTSRAVPVGAGARTRRSRTGLDAHDRTAGKACGRRMEEWAERGIRTTSARTKFIEAWIRLVRVGETPGVRRRRCWWGRSGHRSPSG